MSPDRASQTMEPTEASNLDNQYKYYWEGDLCGRARLGGMGCVRGLPGPWGRGGQRSRVRGCRMVQDPAPSFSGLGPADRMMASETRICTVWTSLTISANTKCKQNSYKQTPEIQNPHERSEPQIPRHPRVCGGREVRASSVWCPHPEPWPRVTAASGLQRCRGASAPRRSARGSPRGSLKLSRALRGPRGWAALRMRGFLSFGLGSGGRGMLAGGSGSGTLCGPGPGGGSPGITAVAPSLPALVSGHLCPIGTGPGSRAPGFQWQLCPWAARTARGKLVCLSLSVR